MDLEGLQAYALKLFEDHMRTIAAKVEPVEAETAEALAARAEERRLTVAAGVAAGVHALAISDFVRRVEQDRPRSASLLDPTAECASVVEFTEMLRARAPHLFGEPEGKGNGAAHVKREPWE